MKIKMTNEEMYAAVETLAGLKETGVLGYAIAKNRRKMTAELKEYFEARDQAIAKYNDPERAKPGHFFIPAERIADFNAEIQPIAEIENEIDVHAVTEEIFTSGTLDSQQMFALEWMVLKDSTDQG